MLKQKKEEVKRLEARVEEMKASIQGLQEEKMQMLKVIFSLKPDL